MRYNYGAMWPFRRKKTSQKHQQSGLPCSYCKSTNTVVIAYKGTDQPDYVKTWRGQRYVTWRCSDCGRDFYTEEPQQRLLEEVLADEKTIDDEDELRAAEEEVRKQTEEEGDRRYKLNGP